MSQEKPIDEYRRLLEQLHAIEARGEEYHEGHDPLLDAMDLAWSKLTEPERAIMRQHSELLDARRN